MMDGCISGNMLRVLLPEHLFSSLKGPSKRTVVNRPCTSVRNKAEVI